MSLSSVLGLAAGDNAHAFNQISRQEFLDSSSLHNHRGPGGEQRQRAFEILQRHSRLKSDRGDFPLGKLHLQMGQVGLGNKAAVQQDALIHKTKRELPALLQQRGQEVPTLLHGSSRRGVIHGVHGADFEDRLEGLSKCQALNLKLVLVWGASGGGVRI